MPDVEVSTINSGKGTVKGKAEWPEDANKQRSVSAASLRAKELKSRHGPESPKPPRRYDIGHIVYVSVENLPYTNALICGYEWGGDNKFVGGDFWLYSVRDSQSHEGAPMTLIREDQITDRISV